MVIKKLILKYRNDRNKYRISLKDYCFRNIALKKRILRYCRNILIVTAAGQYSAFSFSNPVYEPSAPSGNPPGSAGPTYKVEDVVVMRGAYGTQSTSTPWSGIKSNNAVFTYR